ncbi:hypothetical protein D4764_06G0014290 [Scomber scombrus]|uniref:Reverse transcriptase domain-containing protein n=1 Tax=Scomber scombrus TaxID=13677 RepID=A0AAV1P1W2_SCOSC
MEKREKKKVVEGAGKKGVPRKYNKLSVSEALETAEQRLTALATRLKRYPGVAEARKKIGWSPPNHPKCTLSGRIITQEQTHIGLRLSRRTVLMMKDPQKGRIPSNYRPITCLCTTWKFLSGIIVAKMNRHMAQYMSWAQKGIGSNTRGAKHQLLVNRAVAQDCKTRQTNQCTAWIDYKKAYDSIPHTWIMECLEKYNINRTLRAFIKNLMGLWKTTLEAN